MDVSIDVKDVNVIKIVKKAQIFKGAMSGFLVGGFLGSALGLASGDDPPRLFRSFSAEEKAVISGIALGGAGILVGGICGAISGDDKTITIARQSPRSLKMILKKLRKKARIPQYR
jgi:hypothetical protein